VSALNNKLAELAARFTERAPEERAAIASALATADTAAIVEHAHKLAGIAGMLGHADIGAAALALEEVSLAGMDCSQQGAALLALLDGL
jgi:HPt (histidine-containing phosphotransfer) domain-containing protein